MAITKTVVTEVVETTLSGPEDTNIRDECDTSTQSFNKPSGEASSASCSITDLDPPATGAETPEPLLHRQDMLARMPTAGEDIAAQNIGMARTHSHRNSPHMGDALENLAISLSHTGHDHQPDGPHELHPVTSQRSRTSAAIRRPSRSPATVGLATEAGSPSHPISQGVPAEVGNFAAEIIFILICSAGPLLFAWFLGDVNVNQFRFKAVLGIQSTQLPWLQGAFNIADGLSVILSGSLTDLAPPKSLLVGAFAWLTVWDIVGAFTLSPSRSVLFFIVRAMQGLAVGVLMSGSMSILGRIYKPGLRKTRVFSTMAAMAPFGFWLGAIQGGALSQHLPWIFGTNAILCGLCSIAAFFTIPTLHPVADVAGAEVPSLRQFDFLGALCATIGCIFLLFGLTQGSVAKWSPYTYALVVVGTIALVGFFFIERWVNRPLIPSRLWKTRGFTPLMIAYFCGFGAYILWQFYAIQFWLRIQSVTPLTVALYLLPNALVGVLATWIVSRIMHLVPGHYIYVASMFAFGLGPVFFLPQDAGTTYWALSMPGVALTTFGPDLSFAAASIFITSNVARSYQGSAASLLMTVQNLSAAIMTSVADAIGSQVDEISDGEIGLKGLRAIWWFGLAAALCGAVITLFGVRIPKEEEKEHVT